MHRLLLHQLPGGPAPLRGRGVAAAGAGRAQAGPEGLFMIPSYDQLSDGELMELTGEAFAQSLVERSRLWAADVVGPDGCELVERTEAERRAGVLRWCQYRAWAEWWNAVPPAAKQLVLLGDDDFDLKVRLGQQIIDEIKHQRAFSRHVHQLGGDARLGRFRPD